MERYKVKDLDMVRNSNRCIAREISELAYSWYIERARNTEIVDDRNSVQYN